MKASEIEKGGLYYGKVSGKVVVVRVDSIRTTSAHAGYDYGGKPKKREKTVYDVTNTVTDRTTVFRSAAKFRSKFVPK